MLKGNSWSYIVSAGVGVNSTSLRRAVPDRLLPPGGTIAPSRPDILLYTPNDPQHGRHVLIVKYCCDFRPLHQSQQAIAQHAPTIAILQQAGHKVTLCNILLGVSGTIYKDTKKQAKDTCKKLKLHAVTSLVSSIYRTKLHLNKAHADNG
jgi:hypothetical protein